MRSLLIATRNQHKVAEIKVILNASYEFLTLNDFPEAPKVLENAATFEGNARKKSEELAAWLTSNPQTLGKHTDLRYADLRYVLADDSGLEVDILGGAPGVHSARFASASHEENSSDSANNAKLVRLLQDIPAEQRSARFHCVLALTRIKDHGTPNATASPTNSLAHYHLETVVFSGVCEGKIITSASGQNGFGYDPLFVPVGYDRTYAELGEEIKNQISHRARALQKMRDYMSKLSI